MMELFLGILSTIACAAVGWASVALADVLVPIHEEGIISYLAVAIFFSVVGLAAVEILFP